MSDFTIFLIGLSVSVITFVGVVFTLIEMKRLGREADERAVPEHGSAAERTR